MHIISKVGFFLLLPLLFSCYHENQVERIVPEKLLSEAEMVSILTDIQIAEGAFIYRKTLSIEQEGFRESAYKQIFTTYGITAEILNENINYYNDDPEQMELIYEQILAKLSRMEGELNENAHQSDTVKSKH